MLVRKQAAVNHQTWQGAFQIIGKGIMLVVLVTELSFWVSSYPGELGQSRGHSTAATALPRQCQTGAPGRDVPDRSGACTQRLGP
jgi:hypothetical protein